MKRKMLVLLFVACIGCTFVACGNKNDTKTDKPTDIVLDGDETESVSEVVEIVEGDKLENVNGENVNIVITDTISEDIEVTNGVELDDFTILESSDESFQSEGAGLLYVVKAIKSDDYYFIVGSDNNHFYAVTVDTYADTLHVNKDLVLKCIEDKTIFDTFGYMYPGAYRNDEKIDDSIPDFLDAEHMHGYVDEDGHWIDSEFSVPVEDTVVDESVTTDNTVE